MLTPPQIAFFKVNGYLLLRQVLDPALCARARDRLWEALPEGSTMQRDDPATHTGPFPEDQQSDDPLHIRKGYLWQLRECGTESSLIDLVYNRPLCAMAEQLLGEGMLAPPKVGGLPMGSEGPAWPGGPTDPAINEGIRGIYCTRPYRANEQRKPDYGHTDGHPFNLGMVGLIHDVPPDGGAFKVWPGSHRRLYPTFQMRYDQPRIPYYRHLPAFKGIIHSPAYQSELTRIMQDTSPVDCWGSEGDVVLWHHRLVHMAGHNYSGVMRQAVLYDFSRTDLDQRRAIPPGEDMWQDWGPQVHAAGSDYPEALAMEMRLSPMESPLPA
ncbi:MAG: phytanoyl-CoA dioxygenase family protein [Proteobacteria bacterium]|nr:phytanoyl-CoA dioxygenase family protein [Pseudomonadota bacterium]